MTENSNVTTHAAQAPNNSTLIEFPGVNRPAWRRELSERFRAIQQKRARESDPDAGSAHAAGHSQTTLEGARAAAKERAAESASKQLGLVPAPDEPELNPLVAAALRRIERARATAARPASGRAQAATAAARVVEGPSRPSRRPSSSSSRSPRRPQSWSRPKRRRRPPHRSRRPWLRPW
jgi:hypothetical protein